jgi:hypothetical protein
MNGRKEEDMWTFKALGNQTLRSAIVAVALTGMAGLSGCAWEHDHDRDDYRGRPAGYREHDERWERHDNDRHDNDRRDVDRRDHEWDRR